MTNFLSKFAQIFGDFESSFAICHYFNKYVSATFWPSLGKIGLLFIPPSGHTDDTKGKERTDERPLMSLMET